MAEITRLIWRAEETPAELHGLLNALGEEYPIFDRGRGLKLKFKRLADGDETRSRVVRSRGEVTVEYNTIAAAARGIGSALADLSGEDATPFKTLGIMLDVSRNMVMKPVHLRKWMRRLALSGCNLILLYCEDTYELEEYPFFGYMRGGYTLEELRELDAYARDLGIELVGCIQTLGHLEQVLQWDSFRKARDTERVVMVDSEATTKLINAMLDFWSSALSSRRIHIGMDETHDLGRGRFLDINGYERAFDIFNRHLARVNELCREHNLEPMIWSDMYFRLSNPQQNYYDTSHPVPDDVKAAIPRNVQLVYWDYYHVSAEEYVRMIRAHRELGFEPLMGSGIWTWSRLWYDHGKTMRTAVPCIQACRQEKVTELFFTMWGDDGAYCNYDSALAGIVRCADLAFGEEDENRTAARFAAVCTSDYEAVIAASGVNALIPVEGGADFEISASFLLWDDPLLGIVFDDYKRRNHEFDLRLLDQYDEILCRIQPCAEEKLAGDLEHAVNMLQLISLKLELRGALEAAYDLGDRVALRDIATTLIPATIAAVWEFDATFRRQWLDCARPFGLERIQARNAALAARLEETGLRIREYLEGTIEIIDELEARPPLSAPVHWLKSYAHISSGSWII